MRSGNTIRWEATKDAYALVQFVNLLPTDAKAVDYLQRNYPGFFPGGFWQRTIPRGSELYQGMMSLDPSATQAANRLPALTFWIQYQKVLREAWATGFGLDETIRLMNAPLTPAVELESVTAFPFQRALLLLALESWRARFCPKCGHPFAAEKVGQKFCSPKCFNVARKAAKLDWWKQHGQKWRNHQKIKSRRKRRTR